MILPKLGNMGAKVFLEFQIYSIQTTKTYFWIRISKLSKVSIWILNCPIVREERPARFQVNLILRAPSQTKTKKENQWYQWSWGYFSYLDSMQKSTVCNFENGLLFYVALLSSNRSCSIVAVVDLVPRYWQKLKLKLTEFSLLNWPTVWDFHINVLYFYSNFLKWV